MARVIEECYTNVSNASVKEGDERRSSWREHSGDSRIRHNNGDGASNRRE